MRKGALFIELRGDYGHGEFSLFEQLAEMFGKTPSFTPSQTSTLIDPLSD